MTADENMELMRTLDDTWNAQDWDTFEKRHNADTILRWPGQPQVLEEELFKVASSAQAAASSCLCRGCRPRVRW